MFGCMMLVSGCGGDKFAGEWVGVGPDTFRGGKLIHRIKIDKNGSNGKSYMVAWANLDLDSSKPENNAVQLQWRQGNTYRFGGNLNGNTLTVQTPGSTLMFTYQESDKTLHFADPNSGMDIVCKRDDDKHTELHKITDEMLQKYKESMQNRHPEYTYQDPQEPGSME